MLIYKGASLTHQTFKVRHLASGHKLVHPMQAFGGQPLDLEEPMLSFLFFACPFCTTRSPN